MSLMDEWMNLHGSYLKKQNGMVSDGVEPGTLGWFLMICNKTSIVNCQPYKVAVGIKKVLSFHDNIRSNLLKLIVRIGETV